ncbi:uncharacterized protein G2W53_000680 [Senna tora]|uniref:Uncharacterized protein n=1 Tax=Senna tora TaxID=362788 RepID=A0A834XE63_9FABA|nr:uncharacterized protein G2W53_000680 [Senna tora]
MIANVEVAHTVTEFLRRMIKSSWHSARGGQMRTEVDRLPLQDGLLKNFLGFTLRCRYTIVDFSGIRGRHHKGALGLEAPPSTMMGALPLESIEI